MRRKAIVAKRRPNKMALWKKLHGVLLPCTKKVHCAYRVVRTTGHGIYFLAAATEGVGFYSEISLVLFGLMLFGIFIHEDE